MKGDLACVRTRLAAWRWRHVVSCTWPAGYFILLSCCRAAVLPGAGKYVHLHLILRLCAVLGF